MSNYVKKYDLGEMYLDLPSPNCIYELPLLSFSDICGGLNLNLVYNPSLVSEGDMFNIAPGYKFNLQKQIVFTTDQYGVDDFYFYDENGKYVSLYQMENTRTVGQRHFYTFSDDSQRILVPIIEGYKLEYPDGSYEYYHADGKITCMYNKYGYDFVIFNYDSSRQLKSIRFRANHPNSSNITAKTILLSRDENHKITVCFTCGDVSEESYLSYSSNAVENELVVEHYSGLVYKLKKTENEFSAKVFEDANATIPTYTKKYVRAGNLITLSEEQNNEQVQKTEYLFLLSDDSTYSSTTYIDITNQFGVKTRVQYKAGKIFCSYEIGETGPKFHDNQLLPNSEIYSQFIAPITIYPQKGIFENINSSFVQHYYDGVYIKTPHEYTYWLAQDQIGSLIISGWARRKNGVYSSDFGYLNVTWDPLHTTSKYLGEFYTSQWVYFAFEYPAYSQQATLNFSNIANIELQDVKISFSSTHVLMPEEKPIAPIYEEILISKQGNEEFSLNNLFFSAYGYDPEYVWSSLDDMLKYIVKNKKSNNKAMEFYYRQCREVVSITQGQQIMFARKDQNTGLAEDYYLNNYYLGIRQLTAKGTMITIIKDDQAEGFLVYETFDNQGSLVSKQVLDENLDVVSSTSYEDGITVTYQRSDGLITCQTINNKTVLEVTYNDNTVAYIDEFGGTTVYTLDPVWGNVVTIQLPDGRVIQDTYDVGGSALTKKTFGNSEAAPTYEFSYENGYLKSISGAQNMSYGFDYTKGELTGVTKCGSSVEEHVHSLTQTTSYYPKQNAPLYSIVRKYDKYGRLESIDNDALQCSYSVYPKFKNNGDLDENVDNSSSRLAMTKDNVSNETARYCYTDAGLLVEKTVTAKNDFSLKKSTETFEYDDLSRLHKTFYENHQTNQERSESIHYEPVLANQLSAHIEQDGNDDCKYTYVARLNNVVKVKVDFPERDELQKVTRQDMTFGGLHLAKKYTYEGSRVQSVDHVQVTTNSNGTKTERTLEKNQYAYDDAGRITQTVCEFENNANSKTITYAYDSFGRLQRENNPFLDKSFVFCYDDIGNLTNVITYAYAAPDGVLGHPISTQAFTYNADRLTAFGNKAITYNANGEMASFDGWDYSWSKGKLSRMEKTIGGSSTWAVKPSIPSIPSLPDIKAYSFTYNAFGQRTSMSYSFTEGSSSLSPVQVGDVTAYTKAFQYDHAGRLISESNVKTLYAEGSASTSIVYLYDGNTMIGMQYTANGTDNLYYFHRNLQGDVIGIYDTNGVLKVKYNYDAWGNCTIDNTQTTDIALAKANPIRYRGYYYDQDTGLYYLNARYYSPELRRFISPDDTAYLDPENVDGLNLYAYCYNDPVNYADPSGNSPTKWWEWALAGVTTAGLIVGTIFTGGLLGGAFLGAAIGAGVSLGTQAVQGQLNWAQFALDIGVGAISGMLGVSSASRLITTSVGFLIGGASNFASQLISYKSINNIVWWKVIVSACIGGIAGFMGGAGNQNAQVLNSATKVSKAMNSVNKVLGRMNTGYYSSARYAKTALTNVSNRLGKAIIQEQTKMLIESMLWYGGSTIGNNFLMGMF